MNNFLLEEERIQIEKAKQNPEKFGPLYRKYYEPIFRYIYKRMDDIETVHDISWTFVCADSALRCSKTEYALTWAHLADISRIWIVTCGALGNA